jgi:hypothetical protein
MNKILLITTKGCAGCAIMNRLIKEAIGNTKKQVEFVVRDCKNIDKRFLNINKVKDYPTTMFIVDGDIRFIYTGTAPSIVINRFMDIHFQ